MKRLPLWTIYALLIGVISCGKEKEIFRDPLLENRDTTVAPGADFFAYANGGWMKRNPIPASENSNGLWEMIRDDIKKSVQEICENSAAEKNVPKGTNKQKIGDFYTSGMDTATIEKMGLEPIAQELKKIEGLKSAAELPEILAEWFSLQAHPMFRLQIAKDDKNPTRYMLNLFQGGIGLPERDYYIKTDPRTTGIRRAYEIHIQKMMEMSGLSKASSIKAAKDILEIETSLAKASRTLEGLRDPYLNYNKMTTAEFQKLAPSLDWKKSFLAMGIPNPDTVVIGQPEFFKALNVQITKTPVEVWKSYFRWHLLTTYAPYLSRNIEQEDFQFFLKKLLGQSEQKPRWKLVVEKTNRALGEMVGEEYVRYYLPKGTKEKLLEIGNNIRTVCRERIEKLTWMTEPTREKALRKIDAMVMKVGYPDKWKDYSELTLGRTAYAYNVKNAHAWAFHDMIHKFGKSVDKSEWDMTPQTYNAYYDPTNNEIVVPACNIVVPGYGKTLADDAILYGIIGGSTFGHEIIHGFDDQGSQYNEFGKLENWWTPKDRENFEAKTKLLISQFDHYVVLDSIHLRGKATLGENIADLGGVELGYAAFQKTEQWKSKQTLRGLTPDQRYFLAYGYAWMIQATDEYLASRVMSDVHAPAKFRVIGPLSNNDKFYAAFGVKAGEMMYRADSLRVSLW